MISRRATGYYQSRPSRAWKASTLKAASGRFTRLRSTRTISMMRTESSRYVQYGLTLSPLKAPQPTFSHSLYILQEPEYVAIKQIDRSKLRSWQKEVAALKAMNNLRHDHIVRCLSVFQYHQACYIMLEWADGRNLQYLWESLDRPSMTQELIRATVEQIKGLAGAINTAHNPGEGQPHFRHGDLKPQNILWFPDATEKGLARKSKIGKLKIGDWGVAKEHRSGTDIRQYNTTGGHASRRYEPPEESTGFKNALASSKSRDIPVLRSRRYDIWAMGCITLEFLIWLMYGSKGLNKFQESVGIGDAEESRFYRLIPDKDKAEVRHVVVDWMDYIAARPVCALAEDDSKKTALGRLLQVVKDHLLVIPLSKELSRSPPLSPSRDSDPQEPESFTLTNPAAPGRIGSEVTKSTADKVETPRNVNKQTSTTPPVGRVTADVFQSEMDDIFSHTWPGVYWPTGQAGSIEDLPRPAGSDPDIQNIPDTDNLMHTDKSNPSISRNTAGVVSCTADPK